MDPAGYFNQQFERLINTVYAFTTKKSYANEFMRTRDMKQFRVVKKDLSDDEVMEWIEGSNVPVVEVAFLERHKLLTKDINGNPTRVPVLMTREEYDSIHNTDFDSEDISGVTPSWWISRYEWINPTMFKMKYRIALSVLGIDQCRVRAAATESNDEGEICFNESMDTFTSEMVLDEVNVFIARYGTMFRE